VRQGRGGDIARVAIVKLGALGDVVRTTALVPGLRRLMPDMRLTWITAREALPLVRGLPDVARAVDVDGRGHAWRRERYAWVLSLDDEMRACRAATALAADRLSGAFVTPSGERRYTADVDGWFGMGILRPAAEGGLAEANRRKRDNTRTFGDLLYEGLGLPGPIAHPTVPIPVPEREWASRWLDAAGLRAWPAVVGLNTGAGARWRYKSWGEEQTAVLARRVVDELGLAVLLLGGGPEQERIARIHVLAAGPGVVAAPCDRDVLAFAALVAACDVLVTSDSLAMHLGIAARRPVIAFFGPTSDAEIELYGLGEHVVTSLPCRRCYLPTCDRRPHCMESIGVADLLGAVCRWAPARRVSVAS
jgi:heptosyltransferase-2